MVGMSRRTKRQFLVGAAAVGATFALGLAAADAYTGGGVRRQWIKFFPSLNPAVIVQSDMYTVGESISSPEHRAGTLGTTVADVDAELGLEGDAPGSHATAQTAGEGADAATAGDGGDHLKRHFRHLHIPGSKGSSEGASAQVQWEEAVTPHGAHAPDFFSTTKFFACLELEESRELFNRVEWLTLAPGEVLFRIGEPSDSGIYVVTNGSLGVYLDETVRMAPASAQHCHEGGERTNQRSGPATSNSHLSPEQGSGSPRLALMNVLYTGESVGDLDVLDRARRSVTCIAQEQGAVLVCVSRELFLNFIKNKPHTLDLYVRQAIARLWRVAHFVLQDFLHCGDFVDFPEVLRIRPRRPDINASPNDVPSLPPRPPPAKSQPSSLAHELALGVRSDKSEPSSPGSTHHSSHEAESDATSDTGYETARDHRSSSSASSVAGMSDSGLALDVLPPGGPTGTDTLVAAQAALPPISPLSKSASKIPSPRAQPGSQARRRKETRRHKGEVVRVEVAPASTREKGGVDRGASGAATSHRADVDKPAVKGEQGPAEVVHSPWLRPAIPPRPYSSALEGGAGETAGHAEPSVAPSFRDGARGLGVTPSAHPAVAPMGDAEAGLWSDDEWESTERLARWHSFLHTNQEVVRLDLPSGSVLYEKDEDALCFYILLTGKLYVDHAPAAERHAADSSGSSPEQKPGAGAAAGGARRQGAAGGGGIGHPPVSTPGEIAHRPRGADVVKPLAIVGAASFFTGTGRGATVTAAEASTVARFCVEDLERLGASSLDVYIDLYLVAARSLYPPIRQFIKLGLNRVWLRTGDTLFLQGERASSLFVLISGKMSLVRRGGFKQGPGSSTRLYDGDTHSKQQRRGTWRAGPKRSGSLSLMDVDVEEVRDEDEEEDDLEEEDAGDGEEVGAAYLSEDASGGRFSVGRGEPVGEASLLTEGAHDHTALCVRDAELVRMSRASFERICQASPQAGVRLIAALTKRLSSVASKCPTAPGSITNRSPSELVVLTLLPVDDSFDVASFAGSFGAALQSFGPTLLLNSKRITHLWGEKATAKLHTAFYRSKLATWLAEQEEKYRFIILLADANLSAWTTLCIHQADCVLLVANARSSPEVREHERRLLWLRKERYANLTWRLGVADVSFLRVELLLLHVPSHSPAWYQPKGTRAWLDARPGLQRHHHIKTDNGDDFARIARFLAGKAIGLVLSGGGSRGLAHLGVIKALEDHGIPIDVIGGTSQGAFMGALYAKYRLSKLMLPLVRAFSARLSSVRHLLKELTLPLISVFHGGGFSQGVRATFGSTQIEDLWLRFFCVSTDITKGDIAVHHRGLLWKYVRASMTVLGLLPPMMDANGHLLVDGGYVDNIPVNIIRRMGVKTVIVVDVEDKDNSAFKDVTPFDGDLSGWWLLWNRINPFAAVKFKLPRYNELMNALAYVSHTMQLRAARKTDKIDLYLRPTGINNYKLRDYHLMDEIVRGAYRYGWAAVTDFLQSDAGKEVAQLSGSAASRLSRHGRRIGGWDANAGIGEVGGSELDEPVAGSGGAGGKLKGGAGGGGGMGGSSGGLMDGKKGVGSGVGAGKVTSPGHPRMRRSVMSMLVMNLQELEEQQAWGTGGEGGGDGGQGEPGDALPTYTRETLRRVVSSSAVV
eukprot:jgi/Mesvir1/22617/Mv14061-RA.1